MTLDIQDLHAALSDQQAIAQEFSNDDDMGAELMARSGLDPVALTVVSNERAVDFLRTLVGEMQPDNAASLTRLLLGALSAAWADGAIVAARAMREAEDVD